MPRISSLRSIWTTASLGALLSLIVALCFQVAPAFGQGDYGQGDSMSPGMSMEPGMSGDGGQRSSLVNVPSAVKRPSGFSSVGSIRALLYGDATAVLHVDLTKIDYEGLSNFLDEIVDKGAGSVRSEDNYSVQLREYQKASLKSSFKQFLSTSQNAVVSKAFDHNFDEFYCVEYNSDDDMKLGSIIVAVPTDGLDAAGKKNTLDGLVDVFKPITVFERYGYIIGVVNHDAEQEADLEPIKARYRAKMAEKQSLQSYGAYGASSNNSGYNNGNNRSDSLGGASFGANNPGQLNSPNQRQGAELNNELGLSADLLADYNEEIADATNKAKTASRRQVLPRVRNRFSAPATDAESANLFDALKQTNGAAISVTCLDTAELESFVKTLFLLDSEEGTPFAGLGGDSEEESDSVFASILESFGAQSPVSGAKSAAIAISLVGSPRAAMIYNFESADKAQSVADSIKKGLPVAKAAAQTLFAETVKNKVGEIDDLDVTVAPVFNDLFDALAPAVVGTKVAVTLDLEPIKSNAAVFMPLLGGVETKSAKEMEKDSINWNLSGGDDASSDDASNDGVDENDPYFEADEENAQTNADEEKDPFLEEEENGEESDSTGDDEGDLWN